MALHVPAADPDPVLPCVCFSGLTRFSPWLTKAWRAGEREGFGPSEGTYAFYPFFFANARLSLDILGEICESLPLTNDADAAEAALFQPAYIE